jgi:hypothetical protein
MRLRRQVGQMSHSLRLAYPNPNDPPPMDRRVIGVPSRGQMGFSPAATCARMAFCSSGSNCACCSILNAPETVTQNYKLIGESVRQLIGW